MMRGETSSAMRTCHHMHLASLRCARLEAHSSLKAPSSTPVDLLIEWEAGLIVKGFHFTDGRHKFKDDTMHGVLWYAGSGPSNLSVA